MVGAAVGDALATASPGLHTRASPQLQLRPRAAPLSSLLTASSVVCIVTQPTSLPRRCMAAGPSTAGKRFSASDAGNELQPDVTLPSQSLLDRDAELPLTLRLRGCDRSSIRPASSDTTTCTPTHLKRQPHHQEHRLDDNDDDTLSPMVLSDVTQTIFVAAACASSFRLSSAGCAGNASCAMTMRGCGCSDRPRRCCNRAGR